MIDHHRPLNETLKDIAIEQVEYIAGLTATDGHLPPMVEAIHDGFIGEACVQNLQISLTVADQHAAALRFADPTLYEVISRRDQAHTVAEKSYLQILP